MRTTSLSCNCNFVLLTFRLHKIGIEAHAYSHCTSLLCFALLVQKCKINSQQWTAMNMTRPILSYMPKSQGRAVAQKTVMCQYEGCGKMFCHSFHLYRHQREKHGQQYKYSKASHGKLLMLLVVITFILLGPMIFRSLPHSALQYRVWKTYFLLLILL